MKRRYTLVMLLSIMILIPHLAMGYEISWWTTDGGGGQISGGNYAISGTIGQPDAGTLTGGGYTLVGGFWQPAAQASNPSNSYILWTR